MNIAIDISPLKMLSLLQHRVRGTGFYIENLKKALIQYFPNNTYTFFIRGKKLPNNIDLVHYPYFEPFFLTLSIWNHFPTVVTVHDLTPLVFPEHFSVGIKGAIKWQIQKFALSHTKAIITDSNSSKKDIMRFTNIRDSAINNIYLAVSDEFRVIKDKKFLEEIRIKYSLPAKFVLYVGDITWNKNLPRLVEAIKKINLTLVLVGQALLENDFDKTNPWNQDRVYVRESIEGDKRFIRLGFVPKEDLVAFYNLATVFTMPSFYEGFGLPILEAMKCGTPVVTTKKGSLLEVAGEGAFFVEPYDVDNIANGIGEVYFNQKLQQELIKKGLAQARKFTWKKTAEETIEVYKKILAIK